MKILVVEDEAELLALVRQSLNKEGFVVEHASDFATATEKIGSYSYDCILLDIMLPGGSGLDILRELKAIGKFGNVIIISAKDSLDDKLAGLDLGADDYLTKPFYMAELHARVRSVLRRKTFGGNPVIKVGNTELNIEDRNAEIAGKPLTLNKKEFDILTYLFTNKNRLITKTALAEHVWGDSIDQADDFEFIYSQIKNLRKKLKDNEAGFEIHAVYGIGYKLLET